MRVTTLINLDRVLGIHNKTIKINRRTAPHVQEDAKWLRGSVARDWLQSNQDRDKDKVFADFVEKVNGRCAISGLYIGKAVFEYTGQDLLQQLTDDPTRALLLVGSDIGVIMFVSMLIYKRTNYDNLFEFCSIVTCRFAMAQWLWIIAQYFF